MTSFCYWLLCVYVVERGIDYVLGSVFGTEIGASVEMSRDEPVVVEDLVRLRIYGPTRDSIRYTVKKLEDRLRKDTHTILWSERPNYDREATFIGQLTPDQVRWLSIPSSQ